MGTLDNAKPILALRKRNGTPTLTFDYSNRKIARRLWDVHANFVFLRPSVVESEA